MRGNDRAKRLHRGDCGSDPSADVFCQLDENPFGATHVTEPTAVLVALQHASGSRQLVEEEINGGNPAVPGDDEIRSGVCWRIARAARYPWDPPAIANLLGLGN